MKIKFKKVVIIGVGLIGGSMARDLLTKKIADEVVGFDADQKNLNFAVKNKIISRAGKSLDHELKDASLVVLATPVLTIENLLQKIADKISAQTIVMDVGSTKKKIVELADKLFLKGSFVGTHPMAGLEKSGASASQKNLFKNSPTLIVAGKKTKTAHTKKIKALWQLLGARVLNISINDHDRYMAACSHLPHALSFALMRSVGKKIPPAELKKIAGNSFKSYTRISGSDAKMWVDIFIDNQKNTLARINAFQQELKSLEKLILNKDKKNLLNYMQAASQLWQKI